MDEILLGTDLNRLSLMTFPTEILEQVFLLVTKSSFGAVPSHCGPNIPSSAKALSHICKRWRRIAINYSPLWSFITGADFCNFRWMQVVLQRSGSCPLEINFCSTTRCPDEELRMMYSIQQLGRTRQLSLEAGRRIIRMFDLSTKRWALSLENLRICFMDDCPPVTDAESNDYVARINAQHVPDLPTHIDNLEAFHCDAPKLRHLSLVNCWINSADLCLYRNLERLEISHVPSQYDTLVCEWARIIRCFPHLKSLSIDGAMRWCSICEVKPADLPPLGQLTDLRINRCSPGCVTLLNVFSPQPRSLQLTCTDMHYDEEFRSFCYAVQSWLRHCQRTKVSNRYLFISIQPDGIIVHNRPTGSQEEEEEKEEAFPAIHLVLYWKARDAGKGLDLIAPLLNLVSTTHSNSGASTPILGCVTLELSIGLFDYQDRAFRSVISQFLCRFRDVKKLTCIGGAAAMLSSFTSDKGESPFPLLDCVCLDHIDLEEGDEIGKKLVEHFRLCPVTCIELSGCREVSQSTVADLECAGTEVVLGKGTILTDGSRKGVRTKEKWSSDQVKLLMKKWADGTQ